MSQQPGERQERGGGITEAIKSAIPGTEEYRESQRGSGYAAGEPGSQRTSGYAEPGAGGYAGDQPVGGGYPGSQLGTGGYAVGAPGERVSGGAGYGGDQPTGVTGGTYTGSQPGAGGYTDTGVGRDQDRPSGAGYGTGGAGAGATMGERVKENIPGTGEYEQVHGRTGAQETAERVKAHVPGTEEYREREAYRQGGAAGAGGYTDTGIGRDQDRPSGAAGAVPHHEHKEGLVEKIKKHLPGTEEHKEHKEHKAAKQAERAAGQSGGGTY